VRIIKYKVKELCIIRQGDALIVCGTTSMKSVVCIKNAVIVAMNLVFFDVG